MEDRKIAVIIGVILLIAVGAFVIYKVFIHKEVNLKANTTYTLVYVGKLDTIENVLGEDLLKGHILALYHWNVSTQVWDHWFLFTHFVPGDRYLINLDIDATLKNFKQYVSVG